MKPHLFRLGVALLCAAWLTLTAAAAYADHPDPLDHVEQRLSAFLRRTGAIATGLVPAAGGMAVTVLALKRKMEKATGDESAMGRTSSNIRDVLLYTALGTGGSVLVNIAGRILA